MSFELAFVLGLLAAAVVMFAINRPRMDAVAILMMTLLPFSGLLTIDEALGGFSDANIVLIAALFIIGDGLVRTGVARQMGDWLAKAAGASENRLVALLMTAVCGLGSTMSSTAVTAIFIPIVLRISQKTSIAANQLMMPLSYAGLISGMMSLVATPANLVVNSELIRSGEAGFHFFSFTPLGLPVLALAILYMLPMRRLLRRRNGGPQPAPRIIRPSLSDWVAKYDLRNREHLVRVMAGSPLIGKALDEIQLRTNRGASLLAVKRNQRLLQPTAQTRIEQGDILLIDLHLPDPKIEELRESLLLEKLPLSGFYFSDVSQEIGLVEVMVPEDSDLVGQTVTKARFRGRTGLTVIGVRRSSEALTSYVRDQALQIGDTLLLVGPWRAIRNVHQAIGVVPLHLPREYDDVVAAPSKAIHALVCLLITIVLMVSGLVPNVHAAMIGCLLMGACGCISLESAYRSIDWKTIMLIVGMLPFSIALQRTGAVEMASHAFVSGTAGGGAHATLAALFVTCAVLGMFISNTATSVLMAPVAIQIAAQSGASPYPFAMIVALASSTAFMTPVSSPVNTLVVTPGNYSFGDFVRLGVPFSLLVMIVSVLMVPWLFPL